MIKEIFAVFAIAVAINGCSTGVSVSSTQMASFTDRQSTKDDVIKALGQPESRSVEVNKNEEWGYGYTFIPGIPFTSQQTLNKTTVFEFDDHGVLAKHYARTWYTD